MIADQYSPTLLTATQILEKARAAAGQRTPGQYLIVRREVRPDDVTTVMTQTQGEDFVTAETADGHTTFHGSYRGQLWEQDVNGIVLRESGFAKENPNALAWSDPGNPRYRVRVLGLTQTDPHEYVVEANPPGGEDEYRYYNAHTFLCDRVVVFGVDRYRHETNYTDYQTRYGQTLAFHVHYTDGRPVNEEDDVITSFTESPSQNPLTIPEPRPIFGFLSAPVTLPARFSDDGIVIPVQIGDRTFDFALDTGSSDLFIDAGTAHALGLPEFGRQSETIGGTTTLAKAVVPQFSVAGLNVSDAVFTVGPLGGLGDVSGLLGCDFLASAVVGIDLKNERVTLYPWATFNPASLGLRSVPIEVDDCVPRVPGSLEAVPGHFLLDTGSFGTMLYRHYLERLPAAAVALTGGSTDVGGGANLTFEAVGGAVHSTLYDVNDLVFGGVRFRTAQVLVPSSTSTFQDTDYDGIIGRNVLKAYAFYLDYNDGAIFIKPN